MNQNANPLQQFFRQPAIYLRLPSGGQYWPPGSLDMPPNNEIPVLPMTAIDEITYRTPDALFNGTAVVNVIQSCCPNIKDAWKAPGTDLNAILIAIRIASYGSNMELETTCPKCEAKSDYTLNLTSVLDAMPKPDFSESIKRGDLEVYFRPIDYQSQNQINTLQFDQQRILQMIPNADIPEEQKMQSLNTALLEITKITVKAIKDSIASIRTPQALVSDSDFIEEFLNNCDRQLFNQIRDQAVQLRENSEIKPMKLTCTECDNEYEQGISLDEARFFEPAS
jgi:hypothetical protein